jgi:hypothetical protein
MVMEATAKRHVQHKCSDENCVVCNGGLSLCKVCGGAESSMPTECPGAKMTPEQAAAVQAGTIDFQGGQWCALAKLEVVKPEEK